MNILFLGGVFPKQLENEVINNSRRNFQAAANLLQWNLIKGIENNLGYPINILNAMFVGTFPKNYKELYIKEFEWQHEVGSKDINISFINLIGLRNFHRAWSLKRKFTKIKDGCETDKKKVIIAYSLHGPFLGLLKKAKKHDANIVTCLVVPDLPQYMANDELAKSNIYRILKKIDSIFIKERLKYVDKFILLTEQMKEQLKIKDKEYIVVEGIVDNLNETKSQISYNYEKTILYTGTLDHRYGIIELIDAFNKIDNDEYKLIICGKGDAEQYVKDAQKSNDKIVYKGLLDRESVLEEQMKARVLINPRSNKGEYTKYSFPSKTLEYLASGRPLIAYKLDGIPDEYDDYIYYINGEGVEALYETINNVISKSINELNEFGDRARKFVLDTKNSVIQTKRILDLIEH